MSRHTFALKKNENAGEIADILEAALGLKLKANLPTDTVNGSVSCWASECAVEIYDQDEPPTPSRKSTLKRPAAMPTKVDIEAALRSAGKIS